MSFLIYLILLQFVAESQFFECHVPPVSRTRQFVHRCSWAVSLQSVFLALEQTSYMMWYWITTKAMSYSNLFPVTSFSGFLPSLWRVKISTADETLVVIRFCQCGCISQVINTISRYFKTLAVGKQKHQRFLKMCLIFVHRPLMLFMQMLAANCSGR